MVVVMMASAVRSSTSMPLSNTSNCSFYSIDRLTIKQCKSSSDNLILGSTDSVSLNVEVTNDGEPAYLCQLLMVLSNDVSLVQVPTGCTLEMQQLKCLVGNNFIKGVKVATNNIVSWSFLSYNGIPESDDFRS